MCGFTVLSSLEYDKALEKISYRGPSHHALSQHYEMAWGFNRLAIMVLSAKGNKVYVLWIL